MKNEKIRVLLGEDGSGGLRQCQQSQLRLHAESDPSKPFAPQNLYNNKGIDTH